MLADVTPPPGSAQSSGRAGLVRHIQGWLAATKLGLVVMALLVGTVAGLGAAGFRDLIYLFTWLFTGQSAYGQSGHQPSPHLPLLGIWFVAVTPVDGGLLYGPLIAGLHRRREATACPR